MKDSHIEHISILNPQGNFDPNDSYWTEHPDFGGQLVYVKELSLALAGLGIDVDIITRQIKDENWPEFSKPIDNYSESNRLRIIRVPFGKNLFLKKEDLWPFLHEYIKKIINFYKQEGNFPDYFSTHYADGGLSGVLLKQKLNIPFVFTGHSLGAQKMDKLDVNKINFTEYNTKFNFHRRIIAERLAMNHADGIITSTSQERFEQYSHYLYGKAIDISQDKKFKVIPPGINTNIQKHANLAIALRGIENPFEDYSEANKEEKNILDQIIKIIYNNNCIGKVTMFSLNNQKQLAETYSYLTSKNSVFALTSFYEPFGLAPIEAMACGLPAVVTKNGGPHEIMKKGKYGILVNPEDPDDIAQGLLTILTDKETWNKYHKKGKKRVLSKYTWEQTAESYLKFMENISENNANKMEIPAYFKKPDSKNDSRLLNIFLHLWR